MHDIKSIRKQPEFFAKKLKSRNIETDLGILLNLDKKYRALIQEKEKLEQEKKLYPKNKTRVCLLNLKKCQKRLRN